jgi:crotonobetainyl-CoA:carnitine CoA-transferase CaiB-like acyl-CoA transferase
MKTDHSATPIDMLSGIRVLDISSGVAAPMCAAHLASLGAEVIRAQPADDWIDALNTGYASVGRCVIDASNRGKTLEPRVEPTSTAMVVNRWLPDIDVLVCDWNPARAGELGVDVADLVARHPGLVLTAVTPYGITGPHADRPGSELTGYHSGGEGYLLPSGVVHNAVPDRVPVRAGRFMADEDAGLAAAAATVAALVRREATGVGDLVDVSIQEVQLGEGRTTLSRAFFEGEDFDRTYAGYDYAGVLKCVDGWICLRPSEEHHWSSFTQEMGRPELAIDPRFATRTSRFENNDALNEELEIWTRDLTREDVRKVLLAAGCPGGPYLEPNEVITDHAITSRGLFGEVSEGGVAPRRPFVLTATSPGDPAALMGRLRKGAAGPLAGLRVVDLTWVAAGPYATALLAFAGAEVIKVESRTMPDLFRRPLGGGTDYDANIRFVDLNQGKKSVCVDLKTDEGRQAVLDLARDADIVIENFRPGVRARLGLSDEDLWALNPSLTTVSLSGFGAAVEDADRPGYASIFSAESGLSAMTGWPDCSPADVRDTNDLRAGTLATLATLGATFRLLRHGAVSSLDLAARDALILLQSSVILQASREGTATRAGNSLEGCAPYGVFACKDGFIAVSVRTDAEYAAMRTVVPELPEASTGERADDPARFDEIVTRWAEASTRSGAVESLVAAGVPASLSAAASDLLADPHLRERRALRPMTHPTMGALTVVGPPFRFSSSPIASEALAPPLLGQHDDLVERARSGSGWT